MNFEKKKSLQDFQKPEEEETEDWTEEELIQSAKRIIERMKLDDELQ